MAYPTVSSISFLTAKLQVRADLDDHWSLTEIGYHIIEALRIWQALSQSYRDRCVFTVDSTDSYYDLRSSTTAMLGHWVYDYELIREIQYHLLEGTVTGTSWASDQFTITAVTNCLQRNRDRLLELGFYVDRQTQHVGVGPTSRLAIPHMIGPVKHLSWQSVDGTWYTIPRDTEYAVNAFRSGWSQEMSSRPLVYSEAATQPVLIQLAPVVSDIGTLAVLATNRGDNLDPATGIKVGVPDDLTWVVKYLTLADMLSTDGRLSDPLRSDYCRKLAELGLKVANDPIVLGGTINDVPVFAGSLSDLDTFSPGWQNGTGTTPRAIYMVGRNLLCVEKPDATYSVTLDIIRNMPVPASDTDVLQVGPEHLSAVLGLARHMAYFKLGGQEFAATMPLLKEFLAAVGRQNARLKLVDPFRRLMEFV